MSDTPQVIHAMAHRQREAKCGAPRMRSYPVFLPVVLVVLAACGSANKPAIVASPYGDGIEHTEPVFFTGKHYNVSFKYSPVRASYAVKVEGEGHALGGGPSDRAIIEQVASSTLSHFACPTRQRAQIVPGTVSAERGSWILEARCG
jgi:hypothetical protein